jgi:uncharacterized repeat protein (TIGR03987 family)
VLILSIVLINLALLFYTAGVWSERLTRYLKKKHVYLFWTGFIFDISGTLAMHEISNKSFNLLDTHTLTGQIALWLMLAHAIWATIVVSKADDRKLKNFHKYSIIVWLIWLIPYFGGIYISM